jgi:hypothetical protein
MMAGRSRARGPAGITMVELMVALAISALIVTGSLMLVRYMITAADTNRDKTVASLEVQYVGFWISEDAQQAQTVDVGPYQGFPLTLSWTELDELDNEIPNEVVYSLGNMTDIFGNNLWRLERTQSVDSVSLGTSVVGKYLEPDSTECVESPHHFVSSLIVRVAATVDRSRANSTYEIHPRAFTEWL